MDFGKSTDAILAALDAAGLQVRPKEPTPEMIAAAWKVIRRESKHGSLLGPGPGFKEAFAAMNAAWREE